jgi:hypothetical protein
MVSKMRVVRVTESWRRPAILEPNVRQQALAAVPPGGVDVPTLVPPPQRALTTRFIDFWLLGGASLVVWLAMFVLQHFRSAWAIDQHFKNLAITTATLTLLVNNPHFMLSYKLAYSRGSSFVTRHWWQLLAVPGLLLGSFACAYANFERPTADVLPFLPELAQQLGARGAGTNLWTTPRLGDFLFTVAFNLMFFTVGWHYTKQTFGCVMLYANFDAYPLSLVQRNLIKWSLLSVWWVNFAYGNRSEGALSFSEFSYYSLDLPDVVAPLAACAAAVLLALVVYRVFYANYRAGGRLPSLNLLAPFLAIYVWWLPFTRQQEFYMLLTPLFHSLQYLAVVYKLEDSRLRSAPRYELRATALTLLVIAAGWLSFEYLPNTTDNWLGTFGAWHMFFFFTAAMLFINIHHYFIDNVVWRFKDPVVRKHLLA